MRVYVSRPLPDDCLADLRAVAHVSLPVGGAPRSEAQLLAELPSHDAAIVQLTEPITAAVLTAAPRLRVLAQVAVGVDNIDVATARELGIVLTHTPGVLTDATADLTFGLMLAACRRLIEADAFVRAEAWTHWSLDLMTGMELRGATLGIVGPGRIGTAVAQRALPFGMKLAYSGRGPAPTLDSLGARQLPLEQLLGEADVLTLHLPLNAETRHILDRDRLFAMKPGAVLVNTSRGSLIDEAALVDALATGPIRAAGLDVFEEEPNVHPGLRHRRDVVLAPHIGSATEATRHRMARMATDSVLAFLRGEDPPHQLPQ